jgi:hypothetical protein
MFWILEIQTFLQRQFFFLSCLRFVDIDTPRDSPADAESNISPRDDPQY